MSNTKKIIIGLIVLIVLGGLVFWFLSRKQSEEGEVQVGFFNSVRNFLPFGNPDEPSTDGENNDNQNSNGDNSSQSNSSSNLPSPPRLRKISSTPISGAIIFNKGSTTLVRFADKATGNVYEISVDSDKPLRLTNATIPKIARGAWLLDASGFIAQTVNENSIVETSFVRLRNATSTSGNSTPYEPVISKLPTGIEEFSLSPESGKIFYYIANSGAKGYVSNLDGTKPELSFSNFLGEWQPSWFQSNSILISSKPGFNSGSSGFILDPINKRMSLLYSNVNGGSALPRSDGKYFLISIGGDSVSLSLFDRAASNLIPLKISTLSDKCAWNQSDAKFIFCAVPKSLPKAKYPDDWYRGVISTNDTIQKINALDIYTSTVSDPEKEANTKIDAINLMPSKDGRYIIFTNKTDNYLWLLDSQSGR